MSKVYCTSCGAEISGTKFCTSCGAAAPAESLTPEPAVKPVAAEPAPAPNPEPVRQAASVSNTVPQYTSQPSPKYTSQPGYAVPVPPPSYGASETKPPKDSRYSVMGVWGYIGSFVVLCLPIIGFIMMIVWACGGCKKENRRNLARAMLIITLVMLVVAIVLGILFGSVVKTYLEGVLNGSFDPSGTSSGVSPSAGTDFTDFFGGLMGGEGSMSTEDLEGLLGGLFGSDFGG